MRSFHRRCRTLPAAAALAVALAPAAWARTGTEPGGPRGTPDPFVVAPGEQAVVMGSGAGGLEAWAYPLQLFSGYRVRFREEGRVAPLDAEPLLRRVEAHGSEVVRVYVGPDFTVRERLSTPLHAPGAVISYEVAGRPKLRIEVRFEPSLNLMWPGALGGQTVAWDAARSGYVEREPLHGFSALVRSPEAVEHDSTVNAAEGRGDGLAMVLEPRAIAGDDVRRARVIVSAIPHAGDADVSAQIGVQDEALRAESRAHADQVLDRSLRIVTPDAEVNRALASAEAALDQAWVCAPDLGCGEVGGYGPSRPGRRPQYAWFFAGDGLVATEGLLASGRYERAREELAFVARYQNPGNGMIWHEMSLSAPLIDWARRYPYMYVHVDVTLQYLATLADYLRTTGDQAFIAGRWTGIEAAWRYARSLIDPATGLPTIPAGKQGQNEQAQLRDDIRLSSAWIDAADGFARLARATGRRPLATEAEAAAARARRALAAGGWDAARGFWVGGHTLQGAPVADERSDASRLLQQGVFPQDRVDAALDRLATPDFQTDWGVRSLSRAAADYDPNAYSQGAVWALGTAGAASAFWAAHRPQAAWPAWRGLASWSTLDTPGHMHEVLAGDLYHPEVESVPAQTWSSAGLLTSAVHGLLGLEADAAARRLTFAPHLPGAWDGVTVTNLRVGASRLDLALGQSADGVTLDVRNPGPPVAIDFAPEIPLGAKLVSAEIDGRPLGVRLEPHPQDQEARLPVVAASGRTHVAIRYAGGVRLAPLVIAPQVGDPSRNLKIAGAEWRDGRLTIRAYIGDPDRGRIVLRTSAKATRVEGGVLAPSSDGYLLTLAPPPSAPPEGGYAPVLARVTFAP